MRRGEELSPRTSVKIVGSVSGSGAVLSRIASAIYCFEKTKVQTVLMQSSDMVEWGELLMES